MEFVGEITREEHNAALREAAVTIESDGDTGACEQCVAERVWCGRQCVRARGCGGRVGVGAECSVESG